MKDFDEKGWLNLKEDIIQALANKTEGGDTAALLREYRLLRGLLNQVLKQEEGFFLAAERGLERAEQAYLEETEKIRAGALVMFEDSKAARDAQKAWERFCEGGHVKEEEVQHLAQYACLASQRSAVLAHQNERLQKKLHQRSFFTAAKVAYKKFRAMMKTASRRFGKR